jgi:uncharacterized membrane protein
MIDKKNKLTILILVIIIGIIVSAIFLIYSDNDYTYKIKEVASIVK